LGNQEAGGSEVAREAVTGREQQQQQPSGQEGRMQIERSLRGSTENGSGGQRRSVEAGDREEEGSRVMSRGINMTSRRVGGKGVQDQNQAETRMTASKGKQYVGLIAQYSYPALHSAVRKQQIVCGKRKKTGQLDGGAKACSSMQKEVVERQCPLDKVSKVPAYC
jgi:hypothetical protein